MQGDDVGFFQQSLLVDEGHTLDLLRGAVPGQHLTAKRIRQFGHTLPDVAHTDDAKGLASDFTPRHDALAVALARDGIVFKDFTIHVNHHGDGEFGHGLGAVARRVLHDDATTLAFLHVDVVQAREGDGEHLQVGTGIKEILAQRDITLDDDLGAFCTAFQFIKVLVAVGIDDYFVAGFFQAFAGGFDLLDFQAQRLQKDDFHGSIILTTTSIYSLRILKA